MASTSAESNEFVSRRHLFMESAPVSPWTATPADGRQLVRRLVIAASTAGVVFAISELLVGFRGGW